MHTVEKRTTNEYKVGAKLSLDINTNKADIKIISSEQKVIKVTTIQSSKNELKAAATNDLSLLVSIIKKNLNTLSIHNYVEISSEGSKPSSSLHTSYIIEIPSSTEHQIKIFNDFGQINISDLSSSLNIKSKFCKIDISEFNGDVDIRSSYGNIEMKNLKGKIFLESNHSELLLQSHYGDFEINSKFSKINLLNVQPVGISSIEDHHSEIRLSQDCINCNSILFELEKSEFHHHEQLNVSYALKEDSKIIGSLFNRKGEVKKIIDIKSNTSIVYINP